LASTGPAGATELIESLLDPTALFDNGRSAAVEFASALPAFELEAMMADPSLAAGMQVGASGSAGLAYELWLLTQPWGIDLSSISVPVHFAIGELDISVPLSNLEFQHRAVPGSTLTVLPGEGHVAASTRIPEILSQIVDRIE
jgi:pimeloyl-ACP methyl ester carboxylesterase